MRGEALAGGVCVHLFGEACEFAELLGNLQAGVGRHGGEQEQEHRLEMPEVRLQVVGKESTTSEVWRSKTGHHHHDPAAQGAMSERTRAAVEECEAVVPVAAQICYIERGRCGFGRGSDRSWSFFFVGRRQRMWSARHVNFLVF